MQFTSEKLQKHRYKLQTFLSVEEIESNKIQIQNKSKQCKPKHECLILSILYLSNIQLKPHLKAI